MYYLQDYTEIEREPVIFKINNVTDKVETYSKLGLKIITKEKFNKINRVPKNQRQIICIPSNAIDKSEGKTLKKTMRILSKMLIF